MNHSVNTSFPVNTQTNHHDLIVKIKEEQDSNNVDAIKLLRCSDQVSKEYSESEFDGWTEVLTKWRKDLYHRPTELTELVKKGIPKALRSQVWLLLACRQDDYPNLMNDYHVLITKETPFEALIRRDINRTLPDNGYSTELSNQDSLYRLCKAYSIYDQEIGYYQGLISMSTVLLTHMSEEKAFCLLVKMMNAYGVRNLFRSGFKGLQLRFYQLERIMENLIPDLHQHFVSHGIEAHMYASQWFLTLFSAKFPLDVVYHILDLFLLRGMEIIFQVAIALLLLSRKELLSLDSDDVLKYFRVHLPRRYRIEENAKILLSTAVNVQIKQLDKYEKDYWLMKVNLVDPVGRLKKENKKLLATNIRLEQENDELTNDLVNRENQIKSQLDLAQDKIDFLTKELLTIKKILADSEEEKKNLTKESNQAKEGLKCQLLRAELEIKRNHRIISEFKEICSQLSEKLGQQREALNEKLNALSDQHKMSSCEQNSVPDTELDPISIVVPVDPNSLITCKSSNDVEKTSLNENCDNNETLVNGSSNSNNQQEADCRVIAVNNKTSQSNNQTVLNDAHTFSRKNINNPVKENRCPMCAQRFTQLNSLRRHIRSHTGERPFPCDYCEKRFVDRERLKVHVRIHTGEKPFSCNLCSRRFSQKSTVKRHMAVHTGLKPFQCNSCSKKFGTRDNLKVHEKSHY